MKVAKRGLHRAIAMPSTGRRTLCGVSIGYPDPEFATKQLAVPRNPLESNIVFKNG